MTASQMTTNTAHGCPFEATFGLCSLRKNGKTTDKSECKDCGFHKVLCVMNQASRLDGAAIGTVSDSGELQRQLDATTAATGSPTKRTMPAANIVWAIGT